VIELARHVIGTDEPNSSEFDPHTPYPVIDLMADQQTVTDLGGTMRLGSYPCQLVPGTRAAEAYGVSEVRERHRHRFELNNAYRDLLRAGGMIFSGLSPDGRLVEIGELADHPWMVGSQFHPEFRSRLDAPTRCSVTSSPQPLRRCTKGINHRCSPARTSGSGSLRAERRKQIRA